MTPRAEWWLDLVTTIVIGCAVATIIAAAVIAMVEPI